MTVESLRPGDPSQVGPYRILGRLGSGGMGQVFLGRAPEGRLAAVKLVHAELAADPEFRRRFRREVSAAERVSGTWTAPVLAGDTSSAVPWVATGYIPGFSLHETVLGSYGVLPERSLWTLAAGLAGALGDIHGAGLVHRDLKPSNVLIALEGPKVIDFGIARAVDASVATRTGSMIGSPGYMPPEQIRGEDVTGAVDVFALGTVLAFAATGTAPFAAGEPAVHTVLYRVLHEEPELGAPDGPLTGPLRDLVVRCLDKEPAGRPSVAEIAEVAVRCAAGAAGPEGEPWLPAALTARLEQRAAGVPALDGPVPTHAGTGAPPPALPQPPAGPPPAVPPHAAPTVTAAVPVPSAPPTPTAPATGPGTGTGPRRFLAAGAVVAALALIVALTVLLTRTSGGNEDPSAGPAPGDGAPGKATETDRDAVPEADPGNDPGPEEGAQAPLYDLLPPEIQESGRIPVRTGTGALPLMSSPWAAEETGFYPDLAAALGERLGVEFRFTHTDHAQLLNQLAHTLDPAGWIAMGVMPAAATSVFTVSNLDFLPYFEESWVLMTHAGASHGAAAFADLCGKTVATWRTDEAEEAVARHSAGCADPVRVTGHLEPEDLVLDLRSGAADAVYVHHSGAVALMADNPNELVISDARFDPEPVGFAVSVGAPSLRDALQQALQELIDDGTYGEILETWGMSELAVDSAAVVVPDGR
ncbi:protein kinase domain-containing protein [Streptomyces harbinensis]|uniref:protein kinase domain-containing protein n=1 Tax=Streptomyces harbinensis TaxID=1176198 RepID=UPI0024845D31|nr:serine/threonine-protein kinase [Streptomyces harbinensis]